MVLMLKRNPFSLKVQENSCKSVFFTELPYSLLVWIIVVYVRAPVFCWYLIAKFYHFLFCVCVLCEIICVHVSSYSFLSFKYSVFFHCFLLEQFYSLIIRSSSGRIKWEISDVLYKCSK